MHSNGEARSEVELLDILMIVGDDLTGKTSLQGPAGKASLAMSSESTWGMLNLSVIIPGSDSVGETTP